MGKKSRLKRERKAANKAPPVSIENKLRYKSSEDEAHFRLQISKLCDLFSRFNAEDVGVALNVSDLWLPNISSQTKHLLAFAVFCSMDIEDFTETNRIDNYHKFSDFLREVHKYLPIFPLLEDFIPESDWGDVNAYCKGRYLKIFYGGSVERIPDFIEAHRLMNQHHSVALEDMDFVIALQDSVIRSVPSQKGENFLDIDVGHLEVPSEVFWIEATKGILSLSDVVSEFIHGISSSLILKLGEFSRPKKASSFGDSVMNGAALPAVMVSVLDKLLPLSLRNSTSVVVDTWAERAPAKDLKLNTAIAKFIAERVENSAVINGPLRLASKHMALPYIFTSIIQSGENFYLVFLMDERTLPKLEKIENDLQELLLREWVILPDGKHGYFKLSRDDGTQPRPENVTILAVLTHVSTSWMNVAMPDAKARVLFLPDLVTIFDSLENAEELDKFWTYVDSYSPLLGPLGGGSADLFGSFRDAYGLLIDGALTPNLISLDPHWGSNWRFKVLKEFWSSAPFHFPDSTSAWKIDSDSGNLKCLIAKGSPTVAWCTSNEEYTFHVLFHAENQELDAHNGGLLALFVHCLADAFSQRHNLVNLSQLFGKEQITLSCRAKEDTAASIDNSERNLKNCKFDLLDNWLISNQSPFSSTISVEVNLARVQIGLDSPKDASFEVQSLIEALSGLAVLFDVPLQQDLLDKLLATSSQKPRFTLKKVARTVDVPDYSKAIVPTFEQYKVARRDLAIVLKDHEVQPGRYELAQAKSIIDKARDEYRSRIHQRIQNLNRESLLNFCVQQIDALISQYQREVFRLNQSLEHEVSYSRPEALAKAHDQFSRESRNYRYLLEFLVSQKISGDDPVTAEKCVQLVASIDSLFVLYQASDVLHNDIDVAGMEIDFSFIPEVFYSKGREDKEQEFALEMANAKLGLGATQDDQVNSIQKAGENGDDLNNAFLKDLGFSFTNLIQTLLVLARWQAVGGDSELKLCYRTTAPTMISKLKASISNLQEDEALRLIRFLTLDADHVRRLLGRSTDEADVPVWEHNKRAHRYNLRPLISLENGIFMWGAAAADRSALIWSGSISDGYLPADFNWPHVKSVVRNIKASIEGLLEIRAFEVCSRATRWIQHGIDFKRKFPKEQFPDVGDFDVLAYWPERNHWLSIECKYNQPPFCLKDARRLRERIFGSGSDHGQFSKIEGRRIFLAEQPDRLRRLLGWPEPRWDLEVSITEVYVSRDIYWWMRNPPFVVPTHFVTITALNKFLTDLGLVGN